MLSRTTFWEGFAASTLSSIMILTLTFVGIVVAGPVEWADVSDTVVPIAGAFLILFAAFAWKPFKTQWVEDWKDIREYNKIPFRQRMRDILKSDDSGAKTSLPRLLLVLSTSITSLFVISWLMEQIR